MAKKKSSKGAAKRGAKKSKSLLAAVKKAMPKVKVTPVSASATARVVDSATLDAADTLPGVSVAAYLKDSGMATAADAVDALTAAETGAHDEQVEVFMTGGGPGATGPGEKIAIASQAKNRKGMEG